MPGISKHLKAMGDLIRPGQRVAEVMTAERLNAMMLAIRGLARGDNIVSGLGVRSRGVAEGVMLSAIGDSGSNAGSHPFKVINATSGGSPKVRVVFGQVNSITPTIGGTALDHSTPPKLTLTTSGVVYLIVNLDGSGNILTATVNNAASLPSAGALTGYLTLATVTISGGVVLAINQSVTHSLGHQKCGSTTHNFWGV